MTIDKSFIQKIEELSVPTFLDHNEVKYSNQSMHIIKPPMACNFPVNSLSAVIDFCENEITPEKKYVLHIVDHASVSLFGPISDEYRQREFFLSSAAFPCQFRFGEFYRVDAFIINLQAQFVQDDITANILKLVGTMTTVAEVGTKDDGITQRVEAKTGLAKVENVSVPNPVSLSPFRTFIEVAQPTSNFVLRLSADHKCALFEADGGAWKIEAMCRVKTFLDNGLKAIGKRDQITILC